MRKRDLTEPGAPSARCAQRLSSFRVACIALMMLAARVRIEHVGVVDHDEGHGSVQVQLLGKFREPVGCDTPVQIVLALVVHRVFEPDPSMPSDLTEGDLASLKQADQVRTRDVEQGRSLLRAELHFLREDLNLRPCAGRSRIWANMTAVARGVTR
jgi:hypothetical protein